MRLLAWSALCCCLCLTPAWAEPELIESKPTTLVYPPFWHTPFGIHRGTPELLALFIGQRTVLDHPEDLACQLLLTRGSDQEAGPEFLLTIAGANTGRGNLIYNPDLFHLEVIGGSQPPGAPTGVALRADGTLFVADPARRQIFIFTPKDRRLEPAGQLEAPPDGWNQPWGLALDSQNRLYATDRGLDRIVIYDPEGRWLETLGPQLPAGERLQGPTAIAVADSRETWSFYHDDYIFVCDREGTRLLRLDPRGHVQRSLTLDQMPPENRPHSLAWMDLDFYENLWVTDPALSRLHKFDRHLRYLAAFGEPGQGDGRFIHPTGIAIHRHFGQVFVAEAGGAHYFWIGADIQQARATRHPAVPGLLEVTFWLTEPAWMTVIAQPDRSPKTVELCRKQWLDSGAHLIPWRLPEAARGARLELIAEATYSSASYFAKRVFLTVPPQEQPADEQPPQPATVSPSP
ncbi:MAG: NHL repeat-containing protein [candidate division FCPU426 bacterium]